MGSITWGPEIARVEVPQLRRVPPGQAGWIFALDADHVGIETFDDTAAQIAWSHHWIEVDARLVRHSAPYRYVWPSELISWPRSLVSGSGIAGRAGTGRRSLPAATLARDSPGQPAPGALIGDPAGEVGHVLEPDPGMAAAR